jgi:hypothetical protein
VYSAGLVQAAKPRLSRLHSKVEPDSVEVNENVAELEVDSAGGDAVIVVSGAVASISQLKNAGDGSTLPAESVAFTSKV